MNPFASLYSRLRHFLRSCRRVTDADSSLGPDRELTEELRSHLELRTRANVEAGMEPAAARLEALRSFGSVDSVQDICRGHGRVRWFEHGVQDVRYGIRQLRKSPGFTVVAVLTLAVGIGANTAIFGVINALLFRPLPFHEPKNLVWIANGNSADGGLSSVTTRVSNYLDWSHQNQSFESMTAYFAFFDYVKYTLTKDGEPTTLECVGVAQNFLPALGIHPLLGRNFVDDECQFSSRKAVLLTYRFWKSRYQADPNVVGRTITLNNEATEIVGVLPESFDFSSVFTPGTRADMLVPFPLCPETDRWGNTLAVIGRLKPGVSIQTAQNEFNVMNAGLQKDHPERGQGFGARMTGLQDQVRGEFRRSFVVLFCAVGSVLLIACVNVSNLLLARASMRRKEVAVRLALGARPSRIVAQMLTESLLLSVFGAGLGLPFACLATTALAQSHTFNIPLLATVQVDGQALAFTVLAALVTGLACGLLPAVQLFNPDVHDDLKDSTRGSSRGHRRSWAREALVLVEVASSFVLLVGAGLLLHSFVRLLEVDPGFRADQAVAWPIHPSRGFTNDVEQAVYFQDLIRRVDALPGVESAGLSDTLPLGRNRSWGAQIKGQPYHPGDDAFPRIVDPGYIPTMGIPLVAGRNFDAHDNEHSAKVVIINRSMAHHLSPGKEILGETLLTGGGEFRVVGVVGDVRHSSLEAEGSPEMYLLGIQSGWSAEDLVVRTKGNVSALIPAVRETLRQMDRAMPVDEFKSLGEIVDQAISPKRFITVLVGLFSCVALVLASIGIYGVVAYSVSQRTPELGIRLALGASTRDIIDLVIRQGMRPVILGLSCGLIGSILLTRTMQSMLYGVQANDPLTFVVDGILLVGVALVACWFPARRAARVDPMSALRAE